MRPIAVLSLLFLVNSFSLIFADDSEENSKAKIQIIDGSEENSQAPAVLLSSQPLTVGQAQENKNEILTNLQAMNDKLDRIEGTLASIQKVCSANSGKDSCDSENSVVIQAIRESQNTLEIRNYELQQLLEQCDVCKKKDETKTKVPDVVVDGCKPEADPEHLRDCCAIQRAGNNQSGLYTVYPFANDKTRGVKVYCDMETKGGGWTVIQRREETLGPTIGFQRNWNEYEAGFGNLDKTFWLGLPNIASLTEDNDQSLRYDMMSWNGESKFAEYSSFNVANVSDLYRMEVSGYDYSSTAGDSFSVNSGNQFSTEERDNDISGWNCAKVYKGAWWYRACHWANPNGVYFTTPGGKHPNEYAVGVDWYAFNYDLYTSLKRIDMKLRNRGYPNGCVKTC